MPVLIAVAHDILITAGVYSLADREVTSGTVAAFLTILGYSLYDCVIVFDRIRENVPGFVRRRERILASDGKVPAFVDDAELARLDGEEAAQEAEIVPAEEEEIALVGAEPATEDGDDPAAAERRERNRKRRERRQQRRKHGRKR